MRNCHSFLNGSTIVAEKNKIMNLTLKTSEVNNTQEMENNYQDIIYISDTEYETEEMENNYQDIIYISDTDESIEIVEEDEDDLLSLVIRFGLRIPNHSMNPLCLKCEGRLLVVDDIEKKKPFVCYYPNYSESFNHACDLRVHIYKHNSNGLHHCPKEGCKRIFKGADCFIKNLKICNGKKKIIKK